MQQASAALREELNMATHMMRTLLNTMAFLAVLTLLGLWAFL